MLPSRTPHPASTAANVGSSGLDITQLWQAYRVSRAPEIRNQLLLYYLPTAQMIARHLSTRLPANAAADADDLIQAATLGLRDAIASFDPDRGVKFEHYCGPRVRGSALDFLRSLDWAPRVLRSRLNRFQEMATQLEMQSGLTPTAEQLSSALNISPEECHATQREFATPLRLRLNLNTDADPENENGIDLENLPDANPVDPAKEAQRADLREFLAKGLGRIERLVMMLYYYENLSLKEIGSTLELCESRVSQIHQSVLARLRERMPQLGESPLQD